MKRIYLIGIAGALVLAMAAVAVIGLAVMVTPVRAQIGQAVSEVMHGQSVLSVIQQAIKVKAEKGVLVAGVFQDSPADKAGITRGDIVLSIDGQVVNTVADLKGVLAKHKVGDTLQLSIQHGDAQKTVPVTLAEQPVQPQATPQSGAQNNPQTTPVAPQQPAPKKATGPYLGIIPVGAGELHRGGFLGMGKGRGMGQPGMIMHVAAGSPAEKAGLKVGEVIASVDGQQLGPQNSLNQLLSTHKPGDSVKLQVKGTDGQARDVTVTLGDNPQKAGAAYLGVSVGGARGFRNNPNGNGNGMPFHRGVPGLAGHPGALIEQVTASSPAEKAGLKSGQLIVSVDGAAVSSPQALTDAIAKHKPGDQVTLSVFDPQASKANDVKLTLGDNPQKAGTAWMGISYTYIDMQQQNNPGNSGPNGLPQPGTSGSQF